jgi:NADH dehydrogenase FAD-containing subunit
MILFPSATSTAAVLRLSFPTVRSPAARFGTSTPAGGGVVRPRVVILGSGWAGFTLARRLDKSRYEVRVISPANHFLFTPLLPSTAVGTLEFRAIQEPVRTIEGLDKYYQAKATNIDLEEGKVTCEDSYSRSVFEVPYDYLCVAGRMKSNTFHVQK